MRRLLPFFLAVLVVPVFAADTLVKYKEWGLSPQAYFMTKVEREQWSAIKTDAEAEQFVNQFLASRSPGFAAEVAERVAKADKYLTIGKIPGSRTLKGKVIVLLGPPTSMTVASRAIAGEHSATAGAYMNAGADGGPNMADMGAAAQREGMSGKQVRDYTFTYNGDNLPAPFAKGIVVTVEADAATGKDWVEDRKQAAELERLFDAVVASRLTAK